jgi:hypothetical protein
MSRKSRYQPYYLPLKKRKKAEKSCPVNLFEHVFRYSKWLDSDSTYPTYIQGKKRFQLCRLLVHRFQK